LVCQTSPGLRREGSRGSAGSACHASCHCQGNRESGARSLHYRGEFHAQARFDTLGYGKTRTYESGSRIADVVHILVIYQPWQAPHSRSAIGGLHSARPGTLCDPSMECFSAQTVICLPLGLESDPPRHRIRCRPIFRYHCDVAVSVLALRPDASRCSGSHPAHGFREEQAVHTARLTSLEHQWRPPWISRTSCRTSSRSGAGRSS
jgi:hypothetical protein